MERKIPDFKKNIKLQREQNKKTKKYENIV